MGGALLQLLFLTKIILRHNIGRCQNDDKTATDSFYTNKFIQSKSTRYNLKSERNF